MIVETHSSGAGVSPSKDGWYWVINWKGPTTRFLAHRVAGRWYDEDNALLDLEPGQIGPWAEPQLGRIEYDDLGNPVHG